MIGNRKFTPPADAAERAYLESLVREDYDRCREGETFDDMKRRMPFSREDQGIYHDWMALAAVRAAAIRQAQPPRRRATESAGRPGRIGGHRPAGYPAQVAVM